MTATEPGWALARLQEVHEGIRADLATLEQAVAALDGGRPDAEQAAAALADLSFRKPGWSLRAFCAEFCSFIHDHHAVENAVVFPSVLRFAGDRPGIKETVARLRAEHQQLVAYVDEAEQAIAALPDTGAATAAQAVIGRLAAHLTAHLAYEEESLAEALNEMSRQVTPAQLGVPEPPPGHVASR